MIITKTPFRVSLLGGGTDFSDFYKRYGGSVLTTSIDKYVYCIVKERFDKKIYINYSIKEIADSVSQIRHDLVREALIKTGVKEGIEISFLSDIPSAGTGLGSSSSVTVGVLNALYLYTGRTIGAAQLAKEACEIEIDKLKKPMGVQDQYIASYGGLRLFEFTKSSVKTNKVNVSKEILQELEDHLILFFTGKTRNSSLVLKTQSKKIPDKMPSLIKMSELTRKGVIAIKKGDFKKLGKLIDESWQLKKGFAKNVSNIIIDNMYQKALRAGAFGGKISGAGSGGFLTLIVKPSKRRAVIESLKEYKYLKVGLSQDGTKSIFNIRD